MTIVIGLTGSIGMGKSVTAGLFRERGVPVHDADATVHELYAGGAAVAPVEAAFPGVTVDGAIDRALLSRRVLGDDAAMKRLEAIVHPLVRAAEADFVAQARRNGIPVIVLDVPLLFESGAQGRCDVIVVVTAPAEAQRQRVLARPGMTTDRFEAILARQMPDAEKRRRADALIFTDQGIPEAGRQVDALIRRLTEGGVDGVRGCKGDDNHA